MATRFQCGGVSVDVNQWDLGAVFMSFSDEDGCIRDEFADEDFWAQWELIALKVAEDYAIPEYNQFLGESKAEARIELGKLAVA